MYRELYLNNIKSQLSKDFKLCYIEKVDRYGWDEFNREVELYNDDNTHLDLYFTDCDMKDQWGDDWNDMPYQYNAGIPYDAHYDGDKRVEHNIIKVRCNLRSNDGKGCGYYYHIPEDFCSFSVEMINAGIAAWLSISGDKDDNWIVIQGGDSMSKVIKTLKKFKVEE